MIRLSAFADEISKEPAEQLDVLERHGIRHVEFRSIHGVNVLDLSDAQHAEFRALLKDRGFALSAIGSPIGKIKADEPFEPHLQRFEKALAIADYYEAPRIRIFSYYIPAGGDPAAFRDEVVRRTAEVASRAADRGVTLFLENEKGIYGDTAARVLDVLETVDSPALAHAFDPANYVEVSQPIDEAWSLLRSRSAHFHVKDYDTRSRRCVPTGQGGGQIPPPDRRRRGARVRRLLRARTPPDRRRAELRLHRPRAVRRRRERPQVGARRQGRSLRLSSAAPGR